ncbi:hypothetical protein F4678DRAFT_455662 [Xylaria arbuscula]|nr:hypothetical protein F4678DRAFT_455662 [Xylaria arbuscula]
MPELPEEAHIFTLLTSWAICFFTGANPNVYEFRPPRVGDLSTQSFTVHIPSTQLRHYRESPLSRRLRDPAGHCRLAFFKCDRRGRAFQWSHTFHARYQSYRDRHFSFDAILPLHGQLLPGLYYIVCNFYRGHLEADYPDESYTTGLIVIEYSIDHDLVEDFVGFSAIAH